MNKIKLSCLSIALGFTISATLQATPINSFDYINDAAFLGPHMIT